MTQPLALVLFERLLPGSQLVNRLQDLKYRVQVISSPALLPETAEQSKPMLVIVDLESGRQDICASSSRLRQNAATNHLPVIGFASEMSPELEATARSSGVTLVVSETAILTHLPQFLEQALRLD
jgi:PleD family two-component response regulator